MNYAVLVTHLIFEQQSILTDQGILTKLNSGQGVFSARRRTIPRRRRIITRTIAVVLVGLAALTARLFIWPEQGMPARVDAIVMMNGSGSRLDTALGLGWERRAAVLVISRGTPYEGHGSSCAPKIPHITVICFDPDPATTQGEAEFADRLARRYHWRSIALVTTTPQDTRARLRLGRCFNGKVYVITAPLPVQDWPYALVYEWGATLRALFLQRAC